jgi:VIT1/CCC1 family predicted Fe2+/Mn2+ transporter
LLDESIDLRSGSHLVDRIGWLKAALLGANDGIVSTARLIVGAVARIERHGWLYAGDRISPRTSAI